MHKVLVTGANGFLGANLTRELYRMGYEVKAMVRPSADLKSIADIPCEIFFGRIDNVEDVLQAMEGCNIVIHTACITEQWAISFEEYERVNFTGTQYVVEACLRRQVDKLVYVSTANTIGPGSREKPGNELNGFTLFNANSGYINSKYLAQQYVLEQVERRGLNAVVVNPTFMIGPNDSKPSSGKLLLYGLHKKVLFYPPGGKNFVHIHDVCKGILNAIQLGKAGECYLLAGANLSYREFFNLLYARTRKPALMIRIPPLLLKLGGIIGTLAGKITGTTQKLNYSAAFLLCLQNYYTGQKSERELQLQYAPIDAAIAEALNWFEENAYI
ncbi:NAD-dependent epimerase/dehydratase family protein [Chitinophaga sp.]|uniref:NAD-dependent epimerase/dehydratase family protein n=1 Tax=Chitinophaga sp. TaxID=1869181 RepID=UPI0031DDBEEE